MGKYRLFTLSALLFFCLEMFSGCTKSNGKKQEFIKINIDKTNKKNTDKYGDLIVPEFLFDKDVATID